VAGKTDPDTLSDPPTGGPREPPGDKGHGSARARIARAMIELVAARGYAATTIEAVATAAQVSRKTFYECFEGKGDCFLTALDDAGKELLGEVLRAADSQSWVQSLRRGTAAYLQWWESHPAVQRAFFLGLPEVGGGLARDRHDRSLGAFRPVFQALGQRVRDEHPELPALQPIVPEALASVITDLVAARCRSRESLLELRPQIVYLVVKLLADESDAQAVLAEELNGLGAAPVQPPAARRAAASR
jgi:AcrR family transcriptional regulator